MWLHEYDIMLEIYCKIHLTFTRPIPFHIFFFPHSFLYIWIIRRFVRAVAGIVLVVPKALDKLI